MAAIVTTAGSRRSYTEDAPIHAHQRLVELSKLVLKFRGRLKPVQQVRHI